MSSERATVFIPGLLCTPQVYTAQLSALWQLGPVSVADHRRDDSMEKIAKRLLAQAPARFGLVGISMGGYVALEVMRQAPERVERLALLCTSARPDSEEQSANRRAQIELARSGRFSEVIDAMLPKLFAPSQASDPALRQQVVDMAEATGPQAFILQQQAIMARVDSRPLLAQIRCPSLVLTGDEDQLIPPAMSEEMADALPNASLVRLPNCGHLASLSQARQVSQALLNRWQ